MSIQINNIKLNKDELSFEIYNKLRLLGFRTSHHGVTLIYLAVLLIIKSNDDLLIIENIYSSISKQLKNVSTSQIRRSIQYTIDSRNNNKTVLNFEKVFGYEYDSDIFTNKTFLEEFTRILKYHLYTF